MEFNVNQQVNDKMRIFMNFVTYLGSIGKMADLSIQKIQGSRAKNMVVKEIVIKRAQRVNHLRQRKEEIEKYIKVLEQLKYLSAYLGNSRGWKTASCRRCRPRAKSLVCRCTRSTAACTVS